jgi:hypothetical protein
MEVVEERGLLRLYAERKGPAGMAAYRTEKNSHSIDGLPGLSDRCSLARLMTGFHRPIPSALPCR